MEPPRQRDEVHPGTAARVTSPGCGSRVSAPGAVTTRRGHRRVPPARLRALPAGRRQPHAGPRGARPGPVHRAHLVDAHGGRISVASEGEGRGATLDGVATTATPMRTECARSGTAPAREEPIGRMPSLDGVRVLLVDDEADAREVMGAHSRRAARRSWRPRRRRGARPADRTSGARRCAAVRSGDARHDGTS